MPICRTRPVAETGGSITGGLAHFGSVGRTVASRSWTSCRACSRLVPGLKMSRMSESCGTDVERMSVSPGMPFRPSSRGTVTSDSTSEVDSPRLSVWISTWGGAKFGKTSTGVLRIVARPTAIMAIAAPTTRNRKFRLHETIARIADGRGAVTPRRLHTRRPAAPARPP